MRLIKKYLNADGPIRKQYTTPEEMERVKMGYKYYYLDPVINDEKTPNGDYDYLYRKPNRYIVGYEEGFGEDEGNPFLPAWGLPLVVITPPKKEPMTEQEKTDLYLNSLVDYFTAKDKYSVGDARLRNAYLISNMFKEKYNENGEPYFDPETGVLTDAGHAYMAQHQPWSGGSRFALERSELGLKFGIALGSVMIPIVGSAAGLGTSITWGMKNLVVPALGGGVVDEGSKMLTGKTFGQNLAPSFRSLGFSEGTSEFLGDMFNPGYFLPGSLATRFIPKGPIRSLGKDFERYYFNTRRPLFSGTVQAADQSANEQVITLTIKLQPENDLKHLIANNTDEIGLGELIGEGSEQTVYDAGNGYVYKVYDQGAAFANKEEMNDFVYKYLERNEIPGMEPVEYVGYTKMPKPGLPNKEIYVPIFKQKKINVGKTPETYSEEVVARIEEEMLKVQKQMEEAGFIKKTEGPHNASTVYTKDGLTVRDINSNNIGYDENGNLRLIDADAELSPERLQSAKSSLGQEIRPAKASIKTNVNDFYFSKPSALEEDLKIDTEFPQDINPYDPNLVDEVNGEEYISGTGFSNLEDLGHYVYNLLTKNHYIDVKHLYMGYKKIVTEDGTELYFPIFKRKPVDGNKMTESEIKKVMGWIGFRQSEDGVYHNKDGVKFTDVKGVINKDGKYVITDANVDFTIKNVLAVRADNKSAYDFFDQKIFNVDDLKSKKEIIKEILRLYEKKSGKKFFSSNKELEEILTNDELVKDMFNLETYDFWDKYSAKLKKYKNLDDLLEYLWKEFYGDYDSTASSFVREQVSMFKGEQFRNRYKDVVDKLLILFHELLHGYKKPFRELNPNVFKNPSTISNYFLRGNNAEVAARIALILNYFKVRDTQKISGKWLKEKWEKYLALGGPNNNMSDLYNEIADWDALADWANAQDVFVFGKKSPLPEWNVINYGAPFVIGAAAAASNKKALGGRLLPKNQFFKNK